ncbi:TLD domain-containing protein mustard isoform X9 [Musca autumnalis]|uniref:TLD domain-containing protein mustard isoform X9 n=1 Tax=Musca autumnalis TaxID=221902 RepID=UPI003CF75B3D
MSAIDGGKYRLKKDWASVSIPSLVDIDEHADDETESGINITEPSLPPQKAPRRSSLALGLFSSKSDKSQKRRSSIAVAFFRRDSNKHSSKDSYESAVKHEKSDGSSNTPISPDIVYSSEENIRASSPNEPGKVTYFDDGTNVRTAVKGIGITSSPYDTPIDKERNRRRRSSLQTKLDRRRRKNFEVSFPTLEQSTGNGSQSDLTNDDTTGIGSSTGDMTYDDVDPNHSAYFPRQKRHSWWNIFVPENIKNRSKSRSVDHGLAAPFDLDSLRSKVEGRFESVDRLSNERKKSSLPTIPTINYTVGNRDTLTSVAARFDTTPSELTHLNRLNSSFIYPGQQLLVPDKSAKDNVSTSSADDKAGGSNASGKSSPVERKLSVEEQNDADDILDSLRPGSPKPGHIERVDPAGRADGGNDPVITQRFLKINVRHITDGQGVVGGVLLVTPNAVMFDPNVSDPLVIEHGPESYGVIAPMELCVNAAIFHDIAHMRVSGGVTVDSDATEKPEIYYPKSVLDAQKAKEGGEEGAEDAVDGSKQQTKEDNEKDKNDEEQEKVKTDDQESICSEKHDEKSMEAKESSKTDGDGASTGTNETEDDEAKKNLDVSDSRTTLEERRKSLLDHHWAIPSKDRLCLSNSRRSSEDEGDNESNTTADSGARGQEPHSATSSISGIMANLAGGVVNPADLEQLEQLSKQSCYDSGIDIRDPIPNVQPIPKKTVYSDADIVLSSDWVPPKQISSITPLGESPPRTSGLDAGAVAGTRKKTTSVSFSVDDNNENQAAAAAQAQNQADKNAAEKKNKMLKRLSYPLTWVEGLTGDGAAPTSGGSVGKSQDNESAPNTGDSNQSVFSKVFSRRSSIGTFIRPLSSEGTSSTTKLKDTKPQPKLDYRSMVSVDDKPGLFVSVDKLIPRPARACPDPPLYLRLRMGKPIGKAIPLPTSVMSYGKNKLRPEYWFSVPKNRVDELYRFINTWVSHLYGELDEEQIKTRGFELIQDDTEWTQSGTTKSGTRSGSQEGEVSDLTRESWELIKAPFAKTYNIIKTASHAASADLDLLSGEVLSMSNDDYRKSSIFQTGSFDLDFPIPDLIGTTEILTEEHREKLCGHLPARAEGYSWSLAFSTSQHGFSLNSLYRKMQRLESPILIVIEDTEHNVFGALTSCSLHVSDHFYGTGESLLYKFNPSFKVFHWTGENLYFIKGNVESLSIGAGDGRFGLWLDGDLNQGRSQSCSTYGNEPLAPQEDFVIKTLECWAFV